MIPPGSVCLDAQGAQSRDHHDRGIARYVVEHVRALHGARPEALDSVVLNPMLPLTGNLSWLIGKDLLGWATDDRRSARRPTGRPTIYHVMSPFETQTLDSLWPIWARGARIRTVITLYDLIPQVFADHYLREPGVRASYQTRLELIRKADHILAISEVTAQDAVEHLGVERERITVIGAGATEKFASMYSSPDAAWARLRNSIPTIRSGYMLYVAGFEFRKNLERTVAAYGMLPPETRARHQLVIACRMLPSEAELMHVWARQAGVGEEEIVITGYVSDVDLGALYHACTLFVFASIYEGSGLPILEAMSCGAPVVASHTSTGPEILGDTEATFDPYNPAAMAECWRSVLDSPAALATLTERSHRQAAHYTWRTVAERSLEAYERVLHDPLRRTRKSRPRLALVSPWPPERSGIADYSYGLARELSQHVDVDVVVGNPLDTYAPPQERGVRLVPASTFRLSERLRQPDRVLYCMGNSAFHGHVYELMRERPGALLAHDVRLTGFYRWFSEQENPEDPGGRAKKRVEALYGPRIPETMIAGGMPSWEEQSALGIYMTREIQQYVEQIFVHSNHAREILELDRGPLDKAVPVAVLPLALPPVADRAQRTIEGSPLIASFGMVSEVKGLDTLIAAVALLAESYVDIRLTIAGPGEQAELQRWRDLASEIAPNVDTSIPGHVLADDYKRLLQSADVAVQLRTLSNGEASAAVVDCLASGVPTVVSDLGWAAELPGDAVAHVPADCTPSQLAHTIEDLLASQQKRRELGEGAHAYARKYSFSAVARDYLRLLELT